MLKMFVAMILVIVLVAFGCSEDNDDPVVDAGTDVGESYDGVVGPLLDSGPDVGDPDAPPEDLGIDIQGSEG